MPCNLRYEMVELRVPWEQAQAAAERLGWRRLAHDRFCAVPHELVTLTRTAEGLAKLQYPAAYEAAGQQMQRALLGEIVRAHAARYGWRARSTDRGLVLYR